MVVEKSASYQFLHQEGKWPKADFTGCFMVSMRAGFHRTLWPEEITAFPAICKIHMREKMTRN